MLKAITETVRALYPSLLEWRRWLHQHPELSFAEYETAKFIRSILHKHRIPYTPILSTGTLAIIGNHATECIALRADIDALPITEDTGLPFASRHPGIMHACGHDAHTAMLLAAAVALKQHESSLPCSVLCIFQPGEEQLPGGAKLLVEEGILEHYPISRIFGQHLNPELPVGKFGLRNGPLMAATDEIYWSFSATGSHAAQPHRSADLITTAAMTILQLQTLISRAKDPLEPSVLSITQIHGGNATNILPNTLEMSGTLRTFSEQWRIQAHQLIKQYSVALAKAAQAKLKVEIKQGYPTLLNDTQTTELVRSTILRIWKSSALVEIPPKLWAEDFAYYTHQIPGCFWMLGVRPPRKRRIEGLHTPSFNPDERAFLFGAQLLAALPFAIRPQLSSEKQTASLAP